MSRLLFALDVSVAMLCVPVVMRASLPPLTLSVTSSVLTGSRFRLQLAAVVQRKSPESLSQKNPTGPGVWVRVRSRAL